MPSVAYIVGYLVLCLFCLVALGFAVLVVLGSAVLSAEERRDREEGEWVS